MSDRSYAALRQSTLETGEMRDMMLERADGNGPVRSGDVVHLGHLNESQKESVVVVGEIESGIYVSVVVAAFGGVTQEIVSKEKPLEIHPIIMLLLCIPLFVAQMSIIVMLRLDQDMATPVYEPLNATHTAWYELARGHSQNVPISDLTHVTGATLLKAKLLMLLILQLIFFGRLQNTARMLVFLLNPTTWHEIKRTSAKAANARFKGHRAGVLYSAYVLAPITCIAVFMKLVVAYNVLVDSASIILASEGVKNAIFNSLAVSFIGELNLFWFYLCSKILHLNPTDGFEFRLANVQLKRELEENSLWSVCVKSWSKLQCFQRSKDANRIEWFVVAFVIFLLYFRQLGILLQALDTNVLPVSRDVCTFYRWQNHEYQNFADVLGASIFNALEVFLLVDPVRSIQARGDHYCKIGDERNARYDMIATTAHLMNSYPKTWWMCIFTIFVALIVPQIFFAFNAKIRSCALDEKEDDQESLRK